MVKQAGTVVEKRLYDAWGDILKVQDGNGVTLPKLTFFDRGYTGHEHLLGVGLINMNGRLYDPKLHRFLMPDNFVQNPTNSQNYNRYGYVLNNPLMYIDPSGESGTPCDGCPGDFGGNGNGGYGYYYNNNYVQTGASVNIFSSAANLIRDWDELGIKDWAKQNFNFNNWNNSLGNPNSAKFFDTNFTSVRDFLVDNVIQSTIDDVRDFIKDIFGGGSSSSSPQITYQPANAYSFASGGGTSAMVTSRSTSPGGGYNSSVEMHPYVPTATIHMPTDHYFLGANMTALSEGNFFQQAIYGAANSFNIVGQYLMGRGVGDSSMRNLNGTATVTNEATLAFGTMPLMLVGGEGAGSSLNGLSSTFSRNSAQLVRNSSWLNKGNWWRLGEGWNPNIGSKNIRLAWGAHPNHLHEVPRWLRPINNWLRNLGNGHKHYPNW